MYKRQDYGYLVCRKDSKYLYAWSDGVLRNESDEMTGNDPETQRLSLEDLFKGVLSLSCKDLYLEVGVWYIRDDGNSVFCYLGGRRAYGYSNIGEWRTDLVLTGCVNTYLRASQQRH